MFLPLVTFVVYSDTLHFNLVIDFYGFLLQQLGDSKNYPSKNLEVHG